METGLQGQTWIALVLRVSQLPHSHMVQGLL